MLVHLYNNWLTIVNNSVARHRIRDVDLCLFLLLSDSGFWGAQPVQKHGVSSNPESRVHLTDKNNVGPVVYHITIINRVSYLCFRIYL